MLLLSSCGLLSTASWSQSIQQLASLSLEELGNIDVTSVFKRAEPVSQSPAAVYVITREDIRRSGAISLPEALRLAPNLQVARVDASTYAISSRGFNTTQASNKLLVLIDGRSVYTPLHAGVFWDQEQVLLSEIERIEVISGPGGSLWGANAVNGVINVITRVADDSAGGALAVKVGDVDRSVSARYGGDLGSAGAFRVYGLGFERGDTLTTSGNSAQDEWDGVQAGFRADWQRSSDAFTLQGDLFDNSLAGSIRGGNLLSRWRRALSNGSALEVQAYYDKVTRDANRVLDSLESLDLDVQYAVDVADSWQIVAGGGHRYTHDKFVNALNAFVLVPERDTVQLSNVFVQGTVALTDATRLTLGSKLEYSSFTGTEFLPSARVGWQVSDTALLWGAVSRATRTPSRIDRDLEAPGILQPAADFESETLVAYEIGYRGRPTPQTSLSVSLFYNDYEDLRMLTSAASGLFSYDNAMHGYTYGAELWGDYQLLPRWRLSAGLMLLEKRFEYEPNALTFVLDQHAGNDADYQYSFRSSVDLASNITFDVELRGVDELPYPAVPSYTALSARVGWRPTERLDLSIAGFNLLDERHPESGNAVVRRELRRSVQVEANWTF